MVFPQTRNVNNTETIDNSQKLGTEIAGHRGAGTRPFPVTTLNGIPFSRHSTPNRLPAHTKKLFVLIHQLMPINRLFMSSPYPRVWIIGLIIRQWTHVRCCQSFRALDEDELVHRYRAALWSEVSSRSPGIHSNGPETPSERGSWKWSCPCTTTSCNSSPKFLTVIDCFSIVNVPGLWENHFLRHQTD